jgi:hypothetical protein
VGMGGRNEMKRNPGKSKAKRFTTAQVKNPLGYSLGDQKIPEASSCKYLGIILRTAVNKCVYHITLHYVSFPHQATVCKDVVLQCARCSDVSAEQEKREAVIALRDAFLHQILLRSVGEMCETCVRIHLRP